MTSLLRSFMPISTSKVDDHDDDEYSVEYSFALEYSGPPVGHDIPRVVPVDVQRIPIAAVVSTPSSLNNLSLPIIQPIVKSDRSGKKPVKESEVSGRVSAEFQGSGRTSAVGVLDGSEDNDESSGTLGFSESPGESNEISGRSSDIEDLKDEPGMGTGNGSSEELEDYGFEISSEISMVEEEDVGSNDQTSYQGNRTAVVTFCEPKSSNVTSEDGYVDELDEEDAEERPVARTDLKKGLCHRCLKGNRLTEKEECIVCGAKYCCNCVLRAMGSMPEGRKCVTCIGYSIRESKRGSLGKSSKLLKRLLAEGQMKEVIRNELSCEKNQVPASCVFINGRSLSVQDLVQLQSCKNPPKKIKPGKYWYDRVSGFWGKEGHSPCQIISPSMEIGGLIARGASNGNTNVLVNAREITKKELLLWKAAGVHCEGKPHFWLSEDGSYQHEGQKNILGKLWDKSRIKYVCAALSLPFPPEPNGEVEVEAGDSALTGREEKVVHKLLLVGCDQSGTSTIFKQAKILYKVPFSEDERESVKLLIQTNLYRYIGILLEARERFEEECLQELKRQHLSQPGPSAYAEQIEEKNTYSMIPRLKAFSDWLLQVMMSGNLEAVFPAATREYARLVEELVKDSGFQAAYNRRNELDALPRVANYFLDRAVEIARVDYEPSNMDILYAEGITSSNGVASMEFSFPMSSADAYMEPVEQSEASIRYQLIRVHANSLGKNCKWLEMFEDADMVIFCVSLTDYDEYHVDSEGVLTNKMMAAKKLMEDIATHRSFAQKDFLLLLNKFELLEEKLEQSPLSECEWFQDFKPVVSYHSQRSGSSGSSNNPSLGQRAYHYIAYKFKRMFDSVTDRKLYVMPVTGLESNSVDEALKYSREILKWEGEKPRISRNEFSSGSIEASSSS